MNSSTMVPIIDLQDFPAQSQNLIEACVSWGCFRIINHNIPTTLLGEMKSVLGALPDLPMEIKMQNIDVIQGSGYMAPTEKNPLYEALGLYNVASVKDVDEFCNQLGATDHQRQIIFKYSKAVQELAMDIGSKIARGLGVSGNIFEGWPSQFWMNKYSFTPETGGSSGVQIHTDSGFLTILQDDDNVGDLEVMDKRSGKYVVVDPMLGSLLVNLGDVATIWSNGRFHNVKHKVQCKEAAIRLSAAFFMFAPGETVLEPPPELVDPENPRLYAPIGFEDFRLLRLSTNLRAGEALDLISHSS